MENGLASRTGTLLSGDSEDAIPSSDTGDGYTYLPWVDCICAGVPCQDVSVAGKRAGLAGERTVLVYEFARILKELRPPWFLFENVPGLLSSNDGRDFAEVQRLFMVECGYGICWRVLDSQFFGVAQQRRRLFIAGRLGRPCPAEILFERESGERNFAKSRKAWQKATGESRDRPIGTFQNTGHGWWNETSTAQCLRTPEGGGSMEANLVANTITASYAKSVDRTGKHGCGPADGHVVIGTLKSHAEGGVRLDAEECADGFIQLCAPVDTDGVRSFAGLPEGMDSPRYRALGNAVTKTVAQWIAERILKAAQ